MTKLKVLQAGRVYPPSVGGVEQVMQLLSEQLQDVCDTEVLVANTERREISEIYNGIRVVRAANIKTVWRMPIAPSFFRLFKEMSRDKDIVQLHYPFPIGEAAYLTSGYRGRLYVWWHGEIVRQKLVLPFYRPLVNAVLKRADGIMVASEQQVKASQFLSDYREKCNIIPFGVDVRKWNSVTPDGSLKTALNDPSSVILLHVGRLSPPKGLSYLIQALKQTRGCELLLIGEGELEAELRRQVRELDLESRVHFLGPRKGDSLIAAYAGCDVFVFPTLWDSFGLVQIEAMACGKPVINTQINTAVPHVSVNGLTGITVPPRDAESLAKAIQKLVDDKELRQLYGKAAFERASAKFSTKHMISSVKKIYGT